MKASHAWVAAASVLAVLAVAASASASETSERECDILQAAVVSRAPERPGSDDGVYPPVVEASQPKFDIWFQLDLHLAGFPLTLDERKALVAAQSDAEPPPFTPACAWKGRPLRPRFPGEPDLVSIFTRPVVTADGRLAAVAWTIRTPDGRYSGGPCLARLVDDRWRASCLTGWLR